MSAFELLRHRSNDQDVILITRLSFCCALPAPFPAPFCEAPRATLELLLFAPPVPLGRAREVRAPNSKLPCEADDEEEKRMKTTPSNAATPQMMLSIDHLASFQISADRSARGEFRVGVPARLRCGNNRAGQPPSR